ncbi:MAG: DNA recombination protein RmuC [Duncaniella sp.]|nr:DNA recombination protein RmuC [Duncaniella sp.]
MIILLSIIAVALVAALAFCYTRLVNTRSMLVAAENRSAEFTTRLDEMTSKAERLTSELSEANNRIASLTATVQAAENNSQRLIEERDAARKELASVSERLSDEQKENSALKTRQEMLERRFTEMQSAAEERFKNIANEILSNNSATFKQQNEERLSEILSPLREQIEEFKKKVSDTYSEEARELFSLKERLKDLRELGEMMGREAKQLSGALRGNTGVQGQWGEMVLETILEQSGLRKGHEYEVQVTRDDDGRVLTAEDGGRMRPDVVVRYPDGRRVVIDSKASLTAFLRYTSATDDNERAAAGKDHVASVRRHADTLASKKYYDIMGDGAVDFVMMFIPTEAAYMAAMRLDPGLWQHAYNNRVLIVSPSHLVSALKIIEQLWRREQQTANVVKIAQEAAKMYDKFVGFVNDLQTIDANLTKTRKSYDEAMKKLSTGAGNLVRRAENLRALGVKAEKELPKSIIDEMNQDADTAGLLPTTEK